MQHTNPDPDPDVYKIAEVFLEGGCNYVNVSIPKKLLAIVPDYSSGITE